MSQDPREKPSKSSSSRPKDSERKLNDEASTSGLGPSTWRPAPSSGSRSSSGGSRSSAGGADWKKMKIADEPEAENGPGWAERLVYGKVGVGALSVFCRQLAAYLEAGVDFGKALTSLEKQFSRSPLGPVIGRIARGIRRGDDLTEAMAREKDTFDSLFISMIRVAETRGGVPETLRELSRHYEAKQRLFRQARAALIYPATIFLAGLGVMMLFTFVILPIIMSFLADMTKGREDQLPAPTKLLLAFGHFTRDLGWWVVPAVLVGGFFGVRLMYRNPKGKALIDELLLHIPVCGMLLRKLDTTRMARSLSVLLEGGVDIVASLDLATDVMRTEPYRKAVSNARNLVFEGTELSEALDLSGRFGHDVIAIVHSGEETGKLPESLERLAADYEEQVEYMIKNLGSLIQPLVIVMMSGFVLFIILALFLPYVSLLTSLSGG